MFWINAKVFEFIWVISLIWVISYSFYDKWYTSFSSWEFWVLSFVLLLQIKHVIPEKIKSMFFYFLYKNSSWKFFDFQLLYSFDFNFSNTDSNDIFLKLEEILKNENKNFRKNWDNLFLFWDYLKIKYSFDRENQIQNLSLNLKNDKYTIKSLELDLNYYKKIFWIIKDNLWWALNQSISSIIKINSFYTPDYLLRKYSKWYNNLEVKIEDMITLKRLLNNEEQLSITSSNNLDDLTDKLKQYIKLTL